MEYVIDVIPEADKPTTTTDKRTLFPNEVAMVAVLKDRAKDKYVLRMRHGEDIYALSNGQLIRSAEASFVYHDVIPVKSMTVKVTT